MKRFLPCLLFAFSFTTMLAQKDCRQEDYQLQLLKQFPELHIQYGKIEAFRRKHFPFVTGGSIDTVTSPAAPPPVPEKIIIPVVVHILWNSNAQNISDAQVLSQIDVLNKDFSGSNTDHNKIPAYFSSLSADCGISFVLAKTDPQGHATTGIVRKQTSVTAFSFDDRAKSITTGGEDAWNAGNYLNIWVCNLVSGISGYSSSPGGPVEKDGVVISTGVFGTININGPFNRGRTAVHEIGHWLNLRHIWGDAGCGDDKVDDTPTQQGANRGCSSGEKFTCGSTAHGDMYMNFMDFSDDACMYMFTKGQRQRMRVLFEAGGPHNSLLYSNALAGEGLKQDPLPANDPGFDLLLYPNPASNSISIEIKGNSSNPGKKIYICNQLGQIVKMMAATPKLQQADITALHPGLYFIKMEGMQTTSIKKFVKQ
ncbi:MAG TPA: M43 family zinc metalloprotease [Chitinophagaceae bacterium]|nr:M43 family zinc metalloprotease [Chitinophagaceae bacterium]